MTRYNFQTTEAQWQKAWDDAGIFTADNHSKKPKYYVLEMFPYPSGRLHVGHIRNYTIGDVCARTKIAQGYEVLHPMGWDAFGLPAENAAIQNNIHPKTWTLENVELMEQEFRSIGMSYDWTRKLISCMPDYYVHEQKFFLDFLKNGLAYRKESFVNWDPVENTVLANEQVIDGKGWRSGAEIERRKLSQWFLKITDFADELLEDIDNLEGWPDQVRLMQRNWIGKSTGARIRFSVNEMSETIDVFTTRPDTLFGASFIGLSADHPLVEKLALSKPALQTFVAECRAMGTSTRDVETAEKRGFNTGLTVAHPFKENVSLPVYVANFVLMDYGTGAIFGCPAHDQRDYEFATKYKLDIIPVVCPEDSNPKDFALDGEAYTGEGRLFHSDFLDGMTTTEGIKAATAKLESLGTGSAETTYKLRDWGVSRQRYWGCPIPIIHCGTCGIVPVPESQLPVTLPDDVTFDRPGNPLDRHPTWKHVNCPTCGGAAERETDTFDTFFESSWYFIRYTNPHSLSPVDKESADKWLSVDQYIGGIEHAILHLLYARFFTKALKKCGYLNIDEPFKNLLTQGMVCHQTFKDNTGNWLTPLEVDQTESGAYVKRDDQTPVKVGRSEKMSKSKKNVVSAEDMVRDYGADAVRLFMLSDSPPERDLEWTDAGIEGCWRFINRVWRVYLNHATIIQSMDLNAVPASFTDEALELRKATHKLIKAATHDIDKFHFNRYSARLREFTNYIEGVEPQTEDAEWALAESLDAFARLMTPAMPHLCESLWELMGNDSFISKAPWPEINEDLARDDVITLAIQINGKMRATIEIDPDLTPQQVEEQVLAHPPIGSYVEGKDIKKFIYVPGRIANVIC